MTTTLPTEIKTIEQAKAYLAELYNNGESYHPEDPANLVDWQFTEPTADECLQLDKLMSDIYKLPGFDPCQFLLLLNNSFYNDEFKTNLINGKYTTGTTYKCSIDKVNSGRGKFYEVCISDEENIINTLTYWSKEDAEQDIETANDNTELDFIID